MLATQRKRGSVQVVRDIQNHHTVVAQRIEILGKFAANLVAPSGEVGVLGELLTLASMKMVSKPAKLSSCISGPSPLRKVNSIQEGILVIVESFLNRQLGLDESAEAFGQVFGSNDKCAATDLDFNFAEITEQFAGNKQTLFGHLNSNLGSHCAPPLRDYNTER